VSARATSRARGKITSRVVLNGLRWIFVLSGWKNTEVAPTAARAVDYPCIARDFHHPLSQPARAVDFPRARDRSHP
jgi:hypothetical protein